MKSFLGALAEELRSKTVVAILCLATLLGAVVGVTQITQVKQALAHHGDDVRKCSDAQITQAVQEIMGQPVKYKACNPSIYDIRSGDSYSTKKSKIQTVLNTCGNTVPYRNLTLALLEISGEKPLGANGEVAESGKGACNTALYQEYTNKVMQSGLGQIDWNNYHTDRNGSMHVYSAVSMTLNSCGVHIAQAVMEKTNVLPKTASDLSGPSSGATGRGGQCTYTLYNHGEIYDITEIRRQVDARVKSTLQCSDPWITQAYRELTGWNPVQLRERDQNGNFNPNGTIVEDQCAVGRYGGGSWSSYSDLKDRVYHSWRCRDPWIGQVYAKDYSTRKVGDYVRGIALGYGKKGECNPSQYGNGSWSSYNDLRTKMGVTVTNVQNSGWHWTPDGAMKKPTTGGFVPSTSVLVKSSNNVIANGAGNVIANGAGNVIATGAANLIGDHGSGMIAPGNGSAIIANGAGNVIANGGGNIIASGAAN